MIDESRSEEAFKIHEGIIENEEMIRTLMVKNTILLSTLFEDKLYKNLLGDEEGEWAGYLSNVRIFYTRNKVNTYIRVYKRMTKELGVDPSIWVEVPITRLADALPVINADNYEDWLVKANSMLSKDWKITLKEAKGQVTEETHEKHQNDLYNICKVCGKKEKLHIKIAEHNHA